MLGIGRVCWLYLELLDNVDSNDDLLESEELLRYVLEVAYKSLVFSSLIGLHKFMSSIGLKLTGDVQGDVEGTEQFEGKYEVFSWSSGIFSFSLDGNR